MSKLVYEVVVGSRMYGLAREGSDTDILSVYLEDPFEVYGISPPNHCFSFTKAENEDRRIYSMRTLISLISKGSPSSFEVLFAPQSSVLLDSHGYRDRLSEMAQGLVNKKVIGHYLGFISGLFKKKSKVTPKRSMHTMRVAMDAIELLSTGGIFFPYAKNKRDALLEIRDESKPVDMDQLAEMICTIEGMMTSLPDKRDTRLVDEFLVEAHLQNGDPCVGQRKDLP